MLISYFRTLILYLVLIGVIRLMGKRQLGQMEPAEFVVTMLAANLVSTAMQDSSVPLLSGLVPVLTVLALELILSTLSLRSLTFRRLLCGKPVILIENGHILRDNLRKTRITLDELTGHLREKDVLDIRAVQYAILETDGNLSVFPYPKEQPASAKDAGVKVSRQYLPVTLVSDGRVVGDNLALLGKNRAWLTSVLRQKNIRLRDVWLMTCDRLGHVNFYRRDS